MIRRYLVAVAIAVAACTGARPILGAAPSTSPVIVVGVGMQGREVYESFVSHAAGPDAVFIRVPAHDAPVSGSLTNISTLASSIVRAAPSSDDDLLARRGRSMKFGISADDETAWVVRGDSAEIIGGGRAFVFGGRDATDPGLSFLTLHPGDKYNLAARRVTRRAIAESALSQPFVDSVFADFSKSGPRKATVLVARDGKVFVDAAYGIGSPQTQTPPTTAPNFPLLGISAGFNAAALIALEHDGKLTYDDPFPDGSGLSIRDVLLQYEQSAARKRAIVRLIGQRGGESYLSQIARRIFAPIGMHTTVADSSSGEIHSSVDELYRWELGLSAIKSFRQGAFGWRRETYKGLQRESEYGTSDGKRNAFVRFPSAHASIIILTSDPTADTKAIADQIADRLLFQGR